MEVVWIENTELIERDIFVLLFDVEMGCGKSMVYRRVSHIPMDLDGPMDLDSPMDLDGPIDLNGPMDLHGPVN